MRRLSPCVLVCDELDRLLIDTIGREKTNALAERFVGTLRLE